MVERVHGDVGMAGAGGGKGQAAPAVDVGRIDLRGLVEDGVCLVKLGLVNKILAVGDEQIGIVRDGGEEMQVELVGAGEVAGIGEDRGQHAGDGGVGGMGGVELLEEREGLGLVLIGEHGGELSGKRGVVRVLCERGAEEGFGLGILLAQDEQMSQAGRGGRGIGFFVEDAAIGGCGGVELAGFFGELGGEEGIGGGFRRELEGFEQVVGGCGGIGVAIDAGEGAPGAGLERGIGNAGIERGGSDELGTRFGELVLTSEKQAERDVGLKGFGVGGDGAAIESGGIVETVLRVGHVAGVEEGARVGGMGSELSVELGLGGLPVGCGDGGFGGGDFGGDGLGVAAAAEALGGGAAVERRRREFWAEAWRGNEGQKQDE